MTIDMCYVGQLTNREHFTSCVYLSITRTATDHLSVKEAVLLGICTTRCLVCLETVKSDHYQILYKHNVKYRFITQIKSFSVDTTESFDNKTESMDESSSSGLSLASTSKGSAPFRLGNTSRIAWSQLWPSDTRNRISKTTITLKLIKNQTTSNKCLNTHHVQ